MQKPMVIQLAVCVNQKPTKLKTPPHQKSQLQQLRRLLPHQRLSQPQTHHLPNQQVHLYNAAALPRLAIGVKDQQRQARVSAGSMINIQTNQNKYTMNSIEGIKPGPKPKKDDGTLDKRRRDNKDTPGNKPSLKPSKSTKKK
jgi:hypothetical protein